ncbi:MAG: O-antigen ligase family protein [Oscillospiraceae bacterium]|nr:O-antigen ligase family protein [Oscillospiraceae bacterium]
MNKPRRRRKPERLIGGEKLVSRNRDKGAVMQRLKEIAGASLLWRCLAAIGAFCSRLWTGSAIVSRFLAGANGNAARASVFARAAAAVRRVWCAIFAKLKLDKALRNSIFCMPWLWCAATAFLAPLISTMAALALVGVTFFSRALTFGRDRDRAFASSPVTRWTLLFALVYFASIFTSVTVSGSLKHGLMHVAFALFAVATLQSLNTRKSLELALRAVAVSGALVALYGVYQYVSGATGAAMWVDKEMFTGIRLRIYSTLENPNVLSEYLLLVIPFSAALVLTSKRAITKLFFAGCFGVMAIAMLLTFARGGWLGLIFAAAIFLVMLDRRFILLGIVGLIALYFLLPDVILQRFLSIGNTGDSSTSYRLYIWLATLAMLRKFWFTGIGPGTAAFNKVYPLYSYNTVSAPHSHNLFLQVMCDSGIAGIILFLAVIFSSIRALAAAVRRETDKKLRVYQIAAISAIGGFLVQSATDYSFYNYRVTLMFWVVVGISAALAAVPAASAARA